jgi:hypothetical protein
MRDVNVDVLSHVQTLIKELEERVGPGSLLAQQVHNRFSLLDRDMLRPQVRSAVAYIAMKGL